MELFSGMHTPLALVDIFGQVLEARDIVIILVLIVLEGVLSIDNALVLGLLAKRLPKHQQKRALTYGLVGAFVFRLIAVAMAAYLLRWSVAKLLGGGYLIYVALKHFFFEGYDEEKETIRIGPDGHPIMIEEETGAPLSPERREEEIKERTPIPTTHAPARRGMAKFWPTVVVIELTDIAFAIDSILAAIAFIPATKVVPNPKMWVVVTGGLLGVILMRFAAVIFIRLLEKFPRFEVSAYLLVIVIGAKLILEWWFNTAEYAAAHPDHPHLLDFHSPRTIEFWAFWLVMAACFALGFIPKKEHPKSAPPA